MVQDPVKHEIVLTLNLQDVVPCPEFRIHGPKIDNGKAFIRGIGEKRKDVQSVDCATIVRINKLV